MKRLLLAAAAGLTAVSAPAAAQERVDYTLSFIEVLASTNAPVPNPNGVLEPGEAARIAISVSFTPPVGTTVTYPTPPPPGYGTMAGFGSMFLDMCVGPRESPSPSGMGTWSSLQRAAPWAIGNPGTTLSGGALVTDLQAGQFVVPSSIANPQNPIANIWLGVWTPASYAPRALDWQLYPAIAAGAFANSILIRYDDGTGPPYALYVSKYIPGTYGSTTIPIVPAPASLLAVSALFLQQRRRGP
jgi:hypothetical protein